MQQEAPDELNGVECHGLRLVAVRIILPEESHPATVNRQDAAVGDCHPMRVAGQILQDLLRASEWRFHEHHPFDPLRAAQQGFERSRSGQVGHLSVAPEFAILKCLQQVEEKQVFESAAQNLHRQKRLMRFCLISTNVESRTPSRDTSMQSRAKG